MDKEKIKEHFEKHKTLYCSLGVGVAFAGITYLVMRGRCSSQPSVAIVGDATNCAIVGVVGDDAVLKNVSLISSNRQGSPSWVIRCLETDEVFTSQHKAALAMDIPQSRISEQLNGARDTANGFTFERICMAA